MQERTANKNSKSEIRPATSAPTLSCRSVTVSGGAELKDIPGFPNYKADNFGNIWSLKKTPPKIMVGYKGSRLGHLSIGLRVNGKTVRMYVHRLILIAFKGQSPHPKYISRHLNGNPKDNRPENLEWGTYRDNYDDSIKHGTRYKREEAELTDIQIFKIKHWLKNGYKHASIANVCNVSLATIRKISESV